MTPSLYTQIAEKYLTERSLLRAPLRLPDEHRLALEHKVGRDTIRRALRVLETQGAVTRRRGAGTFLQPTAPKTGSLAGGTVGLVPAWWADSPSAWFTSIVFDGVSRWADANRCTVSVLHGAAHPHDARTWVDLVRQRNLAGLIWVHPQSQQLHVVRAGAEILPTVVLGRCYPGLGLHHVMPDYGQAAQLIDEHLVAKGHQAYTLLGKHALEPYVQTWISAFEAAYRRRNATFDAYGQFADFKSFDQKKLGKLLLEFYIPQAPDYQAFVLSTSSYLIHLLADERFRERMRKNLSVVTIDYGQYPIDAYWPGHPIAHVTCDWPQMGRRAMETLSMLVAGHDVPEIQLEPVGFSPGETIHPWKEPIRSE